MDGEENTTGFIPAKIKACSNSIVYAFRRITGPYYCVLHKADELLNLWKQ